MYRENAGTDRSLLVAAFGGQVYGIERGSGETRWEFEIDDGGHVEIHVEGPIVIAATHSRIVFLEYATGEEIRGGDLPGDPRGRPTMIVDEDNVYVARDGEIICYGLGGKAKWRRSFTGGRPGSVALGFPGFTRQSDA